MIRRDKLPFKYFSFGEPSDFDKKRISFHELYIGTKEFFMENFRGAINVEENITSTEFLYICPDWTAYFFKFLLNAVYGNTVINVKMTSDKKDFNIYVDWKKTRALDQTEVLRLHSIALYAGFKLTLGEADGRMRATLYAEAKVFGYLKVYAPVFNNEFKSALNRIFYLT